MTHTHAHNNSEEVSKARLNRLRGLDNHERIDEELYADFETSDAKKVKWEGRGRTGAGGGGAGAECRAVGLRVKG